MQCDDGIPDLETIVRERNPSLAEVIEEGKRLEEEMWQVRQREKTVVFQS